ncbi:ABC transporter permease [Marispirochaeta sp.]|jgi:ABC-2 type transport system permease protein|uniref:ABC transporter permease n=1 Tax=Marispirochaeta sp. TaxID=2038653 RepID=UPI0029C986F8|nr:ABC transporter permease [Marispirochaeta sp.]
MKPFPVLYKIRAFIKRDFLIAGSYQLNFVLTALNSLFILTLLYFIGGMVKTDSMGLEQYGGDYFAFVLIGYGFFQYFQLALTSFSAAIQREQLTGCLESMLGTQTAPETSILLSSLYSLLSSLLHLLLIFIVGSLVFKVNLMGMNLPLVVITFLLAVLVFVSFGILSAAFVLVLKKGDPVTWLITTLNFILGGAFFPLEQMPSWMLGIARFVPATYALDALRQGLINGAGFTEVWTSLAALSGMGLLLFPASLFVFNRAVRKARREGTLILY